MTVASELSGPGLHTGKEARVRLVGASGPVTLRMASGAEARIDELTVVSSRRATTVSARGGSVLVSTVEHLFAALAGLGIYAGLRVEIDGPELPLLDGGAARFSDALAKLAIPPTAPKLRVVREGVVDVASSRYLFTPGPSVDVGVHLETGDLRLEPSARWAGDPRDFRQRIAPARTFAMEREIAELLERGLSSHVDRESVVVIGEAAILSAGAAFTADEPARHKLLDLVGDLYLAGGPPLGRVHAFRPGHAANVRAFRRALELGLLGST